jgi:hypothetical protein
MVAKYDNTTIMLIVVLSFHFLNLGVALPLLKLQNLIKNIGAIYRKIIIYIFYLNVSRMLGIIYENVKNLLRIFDV